MPLGWLGCVLFLTLEGTDITYSMKFLFDLNSLTEGEQRSDHLVLFLPLTLGAKLLSTDSSEIFDGKM